MCFNPDEVYQNVWERISTLGNTVAFCCRGKQRCNISLHAVVSWIVAAVQLSLTSSPSLFRSPDWYKIDPSGIFHHLFFFLYPYSPFQAHKRGDTLRGNGENQSTLYGLCCSKPAYKKFCGHPLTDCLLSGGGGVSLLWNEYKPCF